MDKDCVGIVLQYCAAVPWQDELRSVASGRTEAFSRYCAAFREEMTTAMVQLTLRIWTACGRSCRSDGCIQGLAAAWKPMLECLAENEGAAIVNHAGDPWPQSDAYTFSVVPEMDRMR